MSDRIKKLKIKKQDGTFSDYIPIGADAENIDMPNGYDLDSVIGNINVDNDGSIGFQLEKINDNIGYGKVIFMPVALGLGASDAAGDCTLIQTKQGVNILIDTGSTHSYNLIKAELQKNHVTKIDYLMISHYHWDHVSNIQYLINDFDMSETIYLLPKTYNNTHISSFIDWFLPYITNNVKIYPDSEQIINIDELQLRFLNCSQEDVDYWDNLETTNYNQYSMCCEISCGNSKFFFTGDIYPEAQDRIKDSLNKVDVLKLEHHGFNEEVSSDYLTNLAPKYGIMSESATTVSSKQTKTNPTTSFLTNMDCNVYCCGNGAIEFLYNEWEVILFSNSEAINTSNKTSVYRYSIYIDENYTGISNGSRTRPFRTIEEAIGYAMSKRGSAMMKIIGATETKAIVPNSIVISTLSFPIAFENIEFQETVEISRNSYIHFVNCLFQKELSGSYNGKVILNTVTCNHRIHLSHTSSVLIDTLNITFNSDRAIWLVGCECNATNIIINGDTTGQTSNYGRGVAVYIGTYKFNNLTINDKKVGVWASEAAHIYINNITGNNVTNAFAIYGDSHMQVEQYQMTNVTSKSLKTVTYGNNFSYNRIDGDWFVIPSGADLNSYNEAGRYAITSGAIANSLLNRPLNMPGSSHQLEVIKINGGRKLSNFKTIQCRTYICLRKWNKAGYIH